MADSDPRSSTVASAILPHSWDRCSIWGPPSRRGLILRQEFVKLLDGVVDGEAGGCVSRWELPEGVEELGGHRDHVQDEVVVVQEPLVDGLNDDAAGLARLNEDSHTLPVP
jgi:hypothetical protein